MKTWLEVLKPNTKYIKINNKDKSITLIHPHWSKSKDTSIYRQLLKTIKQNPFKSYTVTATGFMSVEGLTIAHRLQQYIEKLDNVENTKFNYNLNCGTYTLEVTFK